MEIKSFEKQFLFPLMIRLLERISSGEKGKGHWNLGEQIKIKKIGRGRISTC